MAAEAVLPQSLEAQMPRCGTQDAKQPLAEGTRLHRWNPRGHTTGRPDPSVLLCETVDAGMSVHGATLSVWGLHGRQRSARAVENRAHREARGSDWRTRPRTGSSETEPVLLPRNASSSENELNAKVKEGAALLEIRSLV